MKNGIPFLPFLCLYFLLFLSPAFSFSRENGPDPVSGVALCPQANLGPDTVVCSGSSVVLDAGNPGASYLWNDGSTSQQIETFFEGEYIVEVTMDGCTVADTIYVQQGAILYADFSYEQSAMCSPVAVTFSEYTEACNGFITEWSWDFGDGGVSSDQNPVHIYAAPGDYSVKLTVKKNTGSIYSAEKIITIEGGVQPVVDLGADVTACEFVEQLLDAGNPGATYLWSTGETTQSITAWDPGIYHVSVTRDGCTGTDTVIVNLIPGLMADFSYETLSACLPVNIGFTDKSVMCDGSITEWLWEFGDGTTSTAQNPQHAFAADGQYVVRLTITHSSGDVVKRSKKITVESTTLSVSLGSDTTICFGDGLTLDAGSPGAVYLWSTGETTQEITVFEDGHYDVIVTREGCEARDTVSVQTVTSALPKWGYKKLNECLPVPVEFYDSSLASCGQSIAAWSWDFGDGHISSEQNPVHEYHSADSFVVKLTITTSGGVSYTKSARIGIANSIYSVDLPLQLNACSGGSIQLDAGVQDAQYAWYPASGLNSASIKNPVLTAHASGWYSVEVTKCMVTAKDSVYIEVDSLVTPRIEQQGNELTVKSDGAYQWFRDGVSIGGANKKTLSADRHGYYTVKVFNGLGCYAVSDPYYFIPLSGHEKPVEGIVVKCSPNPTRGIVNILMSEIPDKPARVKVFDRFGRMMQVTSIKNHVSSLNLYRHARGLYFIEIVIGGKRKVVPVVLE